VEAYRVRIVITAVIVALLFIGAGYFAWNRIQTQNATERQSLQKQIDQLQAERDQLKADDERTKNELAKVQAEEERLAAANEDLAKTLQQARLTGKIPPPSAMPFPPK
jgi:outer membrane murein-binding lipoprotein Lpp